jgi:hypothetical protein
MTKWIGTAVLAMMVLVAGPDRTESIAATSSLPYAAPQAFNASTRPTDVSARGHVRRYHRYYHSGYRPSRYGHGPYYPRYYARPYYYEPSPSYAPLPFGFSFGFGPWW